MSGIPFRRARRLATAGRTRWGATLGLVLLALAARTPAAAQTPPAGLPPGVVPRGSWQAKPADPTLMKPQTPRAIVIHHTSTRQRPDLPLERKLRNLQSFSQAPGEVAGRRKPAWGDVPYHFYIDVAGRTGEGRALAFRGDSNTSYDLSDRIQIVVEGAFDTDVPSAAQLDALDALVVWLARIYAVAPADITGHNDHAPTDCPGAHLKAHLPALRAKVAAGG